MLTSGVGSQGHEIHHCKYNNTHHKASAGQKFILQRIVGHPEIDSYDRYGEDKVTLDRIIRDAMNTPVSQQMEGKDQETVN